ncbi:hypothetical protein HIM_01146 [Hirsutella minnesotensis 3608]|nr:hypothetical protein HIM_01146 [Hirsutella minnesotensis 3608]
MEFDAWLKRLLALPQGLVKSNPSLTYQPLAQDDDLDEESQESSDTLPAAAAMRHSPDGDAPDSPGEHRDAAALMLIRLGRSPDEPIVVPPKEDARVLRRIDLFLLPIMLCVYFLQALDKATLSYASVFGLIEDTHLVGNQYSWLGSIVFLAQLVLQLPVSLALVKLPIGKFTSAMVLGWGIALAAMTSAHDFKRLMAARFFLGAFEASVGPSFIAITQMWWRRREQTLRIGSWYCMNGLTWIFGSLITYGLANVESTMRPYQVIFLFFGAITITVSFTMFVFMPDSPTEARFLSDEDKIIAVGRLQHNQMGVMSREWRYSHFKEAITDLKTWLWFIMIFCVSVPSNGLSTFGPLIIKSFVNDPFQTILFNVPVGFSHIVAVSSSAYVAMKWKLKGPVIVALCVPPIVGLGLLLAFPHEPSNRGVLLAGFFCLSTFTGITPLIYSWSSQNTAGDTKRKTTSALVFIGACAGNVVGPLLFRPDEAPAYSRGIRANLALFAAVMILVVLTSAYLRYLNRKHSQQRAALGKRAEIADLSLETAADAERIQRMQRSTPAYQSRMSEEIPRAIHLESEGDQMGAQRSDNGVKAFSDATDLENEDFLFVY